MERAGVWPHSVVRTGIPLRLSDFPSLLPESVVHNLWLVTPWRGRGSNDPFTGVGRDHRKTQIFISGFMTVAKLQLWGGKDNKFMVRGHHDSKVCFKGWQHWEG